MHRDCALASGSARRREVQRRHALCHLAATRVRSRCANCDCGKRSGVRQQQSRGASVVLQMGPRRRQRQLGPLKRRRCGREAGGAGAVGTGLGQRRRRQDQRVNHRRRLRRRRHHHQDGCQRIRQMHPEHVNLSRDPTRRPATAWRVQYRSNGGYDVGRTSSETLPMTHSWALAILVFGASSLGTESWCVGSIVWSGYATRSGRRVRNWRQNCATSAN